MHINDFPFEILSDILAKATKLNEQNGVSYTYGLGQAIMPVSKAPLQRYVRGQVPPDLQKWDATMAIRSVCRLWHEWALEHTLRDLHIKKWRGSERWAELTLRRDKYALYELMDSRPVGTPVYRDPFCTLRKTVDLLSTYPNVAAHIRRMCFYGFHYSETDAQIFSAISSCSNLTSVSLPWTMLRHLNAEQWVRLLNARGEVPLQSLELLANEIPDRIANDAMNQFDHAPLSFRSVDFSSLRRLKFFGDTTFMPITDSDLFAIARTATNLEEFHLTNISTITIDGVMAVVKASQSTLRVLEHSPRSNEGFWHPHPGSLSENEHICTILTNCPRLETVSLSVPSMCAELFANPNVRWAGDLQVRALHLCGHEDGRSTLEAQDALRKCLSQARKLVETRAMSHIPKELYIELFFADCIFEPGFSCVHGDFSAPLEISGGIWPASRMLSRKGPYGSTGLYGKDEEQPFERVDEAEFLDGVRRNWISIMT